MKKTLVVNILAGPGAAKSTTASTAHGLLKMHNITSEYVDEFAKLLFWEDRLGKNRNDIQIFAEQHQKQHRLNGKVDVMITDSPLLLSAIYRSPKDELFDALVLREFKRYDNLNFFIHRVKPYIKRGRAQTKSGAQIIDERTLEFLRDNQIQFEEILGDHNATNHIVSKVLEKLGKKQEVFVVRHDKVWRNRRSIN